MTRSSGIQHFGHSGVSLGHTPILFGAPVHMPRLSVGNNDYPGCCFAESGMTRMVIPGVVRAIFWAQTYDTISTLFPVSRRPKHSSGVHSAIRDLLLFSAG